MSSVTCHVRLKNVRQKTSVNSQFHVRQMSNQHPHLVNINVRQMSNQHPHLVNINVRQMSKCHPLDVTTANI